MSAVFLRESLSEHIPGSGGDGLEQRLLLVDDDEQMVHTLEYYFIRRGFRVVVADTLAVARTIYTRHPGWTLVISDYHLPDGNGWELCCWIREQATTVPPFLLISGASAAATHAAEVDFLAKPFSVQQLDARVAALVGECAVPRTDGIRSVRKDARR